LGCLLGGREECITTECRTPLAYLNLNFEF
jgi:hypothetical protein